MPDFADFIEPFVLPVGAIGVLLAGTTLYGWRRPHTRALRWMMILLSATYLLVASNPVAALLAWSLEHPFAVSQEPRKAVAIVVLAGAASIPAGSGQEGELNGAAWRRLWRGSEVYRTTGGLVPVIYSGRPHETAPGVRNEGDMARYAGLRSGIHPDDFWLESDSNNTFESAVNVKALLAGRGISGPVALVTSAWHMRRAVAAFSKQGLAVLPVPCDSLSGGGWSLATGLVPTYEALSSSSISIREWVALASYRLRGQA